MAVKDAAYWERVRQKAIEVQADGCSGVPDFYRECCDEHDIAYRTGHNVDGEPRSQAEADADLRDCIEAHSMFGKLSPMAWWRWLALRLVGRYSYHG